MQKVKYITNKELLAEIHRCKTSFCTYIEDDVADFDGIVNALDEVTPEMVEAIRTKKSAKLTPKGAEPVDVPVNGLIFRLMTFDHIPLDPDRKRKSRAANQTHARCNFPPFKHFRLVVNETGTYEFVEVGRSHWQGDFEEGSFSLDKGKVSNRLGYMFMELVNRYSRRGNWRGYCVDDTTEALTKRGWLRHDEITEQDTILSFNEGNLAWSSIKSIFRDNYDGDMFRLTGAGIDALVTPGHKFITKDGLKKAEYLTDEDEIILSALGGDIGTTNGFPSDDVSVAVSDIDFSGGFCTDKGVPNIPTVPYQGIVWCPETEFGSFMCRRNGVSYLTGNTYVDEMRGHALQQLAQIGLQFDESKSDNPFAFYTTAIRNCLSGSTEVLTLEHGSVPIGEISETDVHLLDGNGNWVKCHIYDHGEQTTYLNRFQGGGRTEEIWSTAEHGWVSNGKKVLTKEFAGHNTVIDDLRPSKAVADADAYQRGVAHGIVYGDGSKYGREGFRIQLCNEKSELSCYFQNWSVTWPQSANGDPVYSTTSYPDNLKAFPVSASDDRDYLLGFIRGWFATDGCVAENGRPTLCGDIAEYEWLKRWGPLVGWHLNSQTKLADETNYGVRNKASLNFHVRTSSVDPDDFLRSKHRERFETKPARRAGKDVGRKYDWTIVEGLRSQGATWATVATQIGADEVQVRGAYNAYTFGLRKAAKAATRVWNVYGSKQPDDIRVENVYCPVVESTGSFALTCGIHSMNCFTRVLIVERKNQNIRDDLLIQSGAAPSYTRQIEHELGNRPEFQEPKALPAKRGRKSAVVQAAMEKAAAEAEASDI